MRLVTSASGPRCTLLDRSPSSGEAEIGLLRAVIRRSTSARTCRAHSGQCAQGGLC